MVEVGDLVKVECRDWTYIKEEDQTKVFTGKVESAFNAIGASGDSWIYEIRSKDGSWFLYKPEIDGGSIVILKKASK